MKNAVAFVVPTAMLLLVAAAPVQAQLRIVAYNTLDKPFTSTDETDFRTIADAIAATPRNGIAKRPDIISLQEQRTFSVTDSTAVRIADELNDLFGVTSYTDELLGFGNDRVAVVYDASTVSLNSTTSFGTGGPRPTLRTEFSPVGYTSPDATFYLYTSHLKAGSSGSDVSTRATEATNIRANADALGSGVNAIYAGDFNFGSSFESGYFNFTAAGNAQAVDPLALSSWPSGLASEHLTQSTRTVNLSDGGASGGVDDRFDLQIVTDDLLDGEGLSYIGPTSTGLGSLEHSYHAFGNDGVSFNQAINNTTIGRSQSATVLNALHDFSDHLPVVVDYQVPAVVGASNPVLPSTISIGTPALVDFSVFNDADVVGVLGADELEYEISLTGDVLALFGSSTGTDDALGGVNDHQAVLDNTTVGPKSGQIIITSTSEGVNPTPLTLDLVWTVVGGGIPGDTDGDGDVDLLDLDTLGTNFGAGPGAVGGASIGDFNDDGFVNLVDLDTLGVNFGTGTSAAVPEPSSMAALVSALIGWRSRRIRG